MTIFTARRTHLRALIAVSAFATAQAVLGDPPALDGISADYEAKYASLRTIRADYSWTSEPIAPEELLFQEQHLIVGLPPVSVTIVMHQDGRLYYRSADPSQKLPELLLMHFVKKFPLLKQDPNALFSDIPFADVQEYCKELAPSLADKRARLIVYDGQQLIEHDESDVLTDAVQTSRPGYQVQNPARFTGSFIPPTLLDRMLLTFLIPGLPNETEGRQSNRIPDLASQPGVVLQAEPQSVDDAECIVLEQTGKQILFLDPALDFAPRKREWYADGAIRLAVHHQEFQKYSDHVWLPKRSVETQYGGKRFAGGKYLGKPLFRHVFEVESIRINDPEDLKLLKLEIPAGSAVADQTLVPLDKDGNPSQHHSSLTENVIPSVSYIQPANQADLDRVVRAARLDAGVTREEKPAPSRRMSILIVANVIVVVVAIGFFLSRRSSVK